MEKACGERGSPQAGEEKGSRRLKDDHTTV